jgi:predicted lipid-binding transport protein (Tim44 family)
MDGKIDIFTIMFLVLAVVIILKLRSVLGRRTGDDEARIDRNRQRALERAQAAGKNGAANDKVVALPRRDRPDQAGETTAAATAADAAAEERVRAFAGGDGNLEDGLLSIVRADRGFDPEGFLKGARQAYEMIVTAFAEGNRKALRTLLSKEVFDGFAGAISDREARGEIIDQSFVGINKADILEAEVSGKGIASITVRFVSQLISATRDKSGKIIDGDDARIKDVTDIWTFSRDVSTREARRNLNWKLVATQAPN